MRIAHRKTASTKTAEWNRARFPASGLREECLEQIRLWNRLEDLPRILTRDTGHYAELDYLCNDYRRYGLEKMVASYGGRLVQTLDASAFDCARQLGPTSRVA